MILPDPLDVGDLKISRLPNTADVLDQTYAIKKDAMFDVVSERWGWDDARQRQFHLARFGQKPFSGIFKAAELIGTLSIEDHVDHVRFGEFYLLKGFRGAGLGGLILTEILTWTDKASRPVHLEYLKWNPVQSLYRQHGFEAVGETDIHIHMIRPPH